MKAWQHLDQFRGDAPFEHWLSRIAVRTCYDALRRRRREPEQVPVDSVPLAAPDDTRCAAAGTAPTGKATADTAPANPVP